MSQFTGFSKDTISFYKDLKENNTKKWFEDNKNRYLESVIAPAQAFVTAMGEQLLSLSENINFDTRHHGPGSIFRIHRDTRFSKDTTPYKTHLGMYFWVGTGKKMECPGYYFHLEGDTIMLGAGSYMFTRNQLAAFRNAVDDRKNGEALKKTVDKVTKNPLYSIGGEHYKKVPRGFSPTHPRARLLLYNGLYASLETRIPAEFYSSSLVQWCFGHYKSCKPLVDWLFHNI